MGEFFSHVAVIGQKEYASGIPVQTSNRINSLRALSGNQVHNGLAGVRIVCGGYAVFRLVHYDVNLFLALDNLTVEADLVPLEYLGSQLSNSLSVYGYDALENIFVGFPSGTDSGVCDEAVQADALLSLGLRFARLRGVGFHARLPRGYNGFPSFKLASNLLKIIAGTLGPGWLCGESFLDFL